MNETFSFKKENMKEILMGDGIIMRIQRIGFAIARVYFVDNNNSEISIPHGLVIRDITNNVPVSPIRKTQCYALAWSDTYKITFNGKVVIDLTTQRQWSMRTPDDTL